MRNNSIYRISFYPPYEKVPELFLSFPFFLGKIEYICPHKYNKTSFCHEEIRKHSYR